MSSFDCDLCNNSSQKTPKSCQHLEPPKDDNEHGTDDESNHSDSDLEDFNSDPSPYNCSEYDSGDTSDTDGQYESSFVTTDDEEEWEHGNLSYVEDESSSYTSMDNDEDIADDSSSDSMVISLCEEFQRE